jgi:hypothetical protein
LGLDLGPIGNVAFWVLLIAGIASWGARPENQKWLEPTVILSGSVTFCAVAWKIISAGPVPAIIFIAFVLGAVIEYMRSR